MLPVHSGRYVLPLAFAVVLAFAVAAPGLAQSTGTVKGKVVDAQDKVVEGAQITIEFRGGVTRTMSTKTNRRGEYTQVGLQPGAWRITAQKEGVGSQGFDVQVRLGETTEVNFKLAAGPNKEEVARAAAIKTLFDEGVVASRANDFDTALAKFMEAATLLPKCFDCYYNIGYAYSQKKEYNKAEEAFKKAIELKPEYVEAYNGLATVYNAQKKFDEAQAALQKAQEVAPTGGAAGGGSVEQLYNQGVIAWNAGKAEDAKKAFEEAIKVKPDHADSHYQLGMCFINLGKLADAVAPFETYLKLAPEGQYAAQVKAMLPQLKK